MRKKITGRMKRKSETRRRRRGCFLWWSKEESRSDERKNRISREKQKEREREEGRNVVVGRWIVSLGDEKKGGRTECVGIMETM